MPTAEMIRPTTEDPNKIENELTCEKSAEYGAFIQVLQKSGNNISYITYGLPRDIPRESLGRMAVNILYPEPEMGAEIKTASFSNGDLHVLSRPGFNINAADRLLTVPRSVLASDHSDHESESMLAYFDRYQKMIQEMGGIKKEFIDTLFSSNPQQKVADGKHIYHGAYEWKNGSAYGLNLTGDKEFNIVDLPTTEGHRKQMGEVIKAFSENENVTIVLADGGPTVGDCFASCSRFFEMKAGEVQDSSSFGKNELQSVDTYQLLQVGPSIFGAEKMKQTLCDKCSEHKSKCQCNSSEASSGGEE